MFGKKVLVLALAVAMLLTLTPVTAFALSETGDTGDIQPLDDDDLVLEGNCGDQGDNVTFRMTITDALEYEISIRGSGAMADYLTTRPPWYYFRAKISLVVIGEGVTVIGAGSFLGCKFTSIDIPNTVTTIGDFALSSCTSLTSIFLRSNVTTIGEGAFTGCTSLSSITLPNGVTSIATNTFQNCSNLRSITLPNSVTTIGVFAFTGCTRLSSVAIPYGVTSIGYYAFQDCSSLSSITIPYGVTSINDYVFRGCDSLSSVTLPSTVTSIGIEAFKNCTSLSSITLPNTITSIGEGAFQSCTRLSSVTLPNGLSSLGSSAFRDCDYLTRIIIPGRVTSLGSNAFYSCESLNTITFRGAAAPALGTDTFTGAAGSGALYYPAGGSGYGDPTWLDHLGLDFSGGWTAYPAAVQDSLIINLNGCSSFKAAVETQASGIDLLEIAHLAITGQTTVGAGWSTDDRDYLRANFTGNYTLDLSGTAVGVINITSAFSGCTHITALVLPSSGSIGTSAFQYCTGLTGTLTIPASVSSIGGSAFSGCTGITGLTLPSSGSLTIGNGAFNGCTGLTGTLTIPASASVSLGGYAFQGCTGLTGTLTIPASVSSIGGQAFSGCTGITALDLSAYSGGIDIGAFYGCTGLTGTLTIPASVTRVSEYAFQGCTGITTLVFKGSASGVHNNAFNDPRSTGTLYYPTGATGYQAGVFCSPALDGWTRVATSFTAPVTAQDPAPHTPTLATDIPQTGDSSNITGWLAVLILSAVWVVGTLAWRRREKVTGRQ